MSGITRHIRQTASRFGVSIEAGSRAHSSLIGFFRALSMQGFAPALVFDIGANRGAWTRSALSVFPQAHYILFEPQADLIREIAPNVEWRACGVLDKPGRAGFTRVARDDSSTFRESAKGRRDTVDVTTIDAEIGDGRAPDMIKIDAEGTDLAVLRGASRALGHTEVFLVEAGALAPIENDIATVCAFMRDAGYRLAQITALNNSAQSRLLWLVELAFIRDGSPLLARAGSY